MFLLTMVMSYVYLFIYTDVYLFICTNIPLSQVKVAIIYT